MTYPVMYVERHHRSKQQQYKEHQYKEHKTKISILRRGAPPRMQTAAIKDIMS
jgi:hypothetical protein